MEWVNSQANCIEPKAGDVKPPYKFPNIERNEEIKVGKSAAGKVAVSTTGDNSIESG